MDCCWEFWGALDNLHCLSLKVKVGDFVDEGCHQDVEVAAWCRPPSPRLPCAWQQPRSQISLRLWKNVRLKRLTFVWGWSQIQICISSAQVVGRSWEQLYHIMRMVFKSPWKSLSWMCGTQANALKNEMEPFIPPNMNNPKPSGAELRLALPIPVHALRTDRHYK